MSGPNHPTASGNEPGNATGDDRTRRSAFRPPIAAERLLERFLEYVRVDTTANDCTDQYPSCPGQRMLGAQLVDQLRQMGVENAHQDEHGLVHAELVSRAAADLPTICWNAHLDTSPETTGQGVRPQVIRDYRGGDIRLPSDSSRVIRTTENPELDHLLGATLVTTDGTTLLGADDKAGVAIIMEAVATLQQNPQVPHGPIRILFTCDEEIGRGVDHVDVASLGSTVCYTLDGPGAGQIDVATFSADLATMTVRGVNIHPSIAKDRMVNALKVAAALLEGLPADAAPETTEGDQGFLHPYAVEGGVGEVTLKILLRDFETKNLARQADLLRRAAAVALAKYPAAQIDVDIVPQYRNLADGLAEQPRAVACAIRAFEQLDLPYSLSKIRGGTDGSRLTELGLPTPNLSSGQHNPHSVLEWACLDEMVQATAVLVELARCWTEP